MTEEDGPRQDAALAAAREAVGEREVIELTAEGSRLFVEALVDPPEPNESLRALLARRDRGTRRQGPSEPGPGAFRGVLGEER